MIYPLEGTSDFNLRLDSTCSCISVGYRSTHKRIVKIHADLPPALCIHIKRIHILPTFVSLVRQGHHDFDNIKSLDFMWTSLMWYGEQQANIHYHYTMYAFEGTSSDIKA